MCARFFGFIGGAKHSGLIMGVWLGRGGMTLNHLLFADDYILFGTTSMEGVAGVLHVVSEYK